MTTCPQCGVEVMDGAAFCHKCGANIPTEQDASPPAAAASPAETRPDAPAAGRSPRDAMQAARPAHLGEDKEVDLWQGDFSAKAMMGTWILAGIVTVAAVVLGIVLAFDTFAWLVTAGVILAVWVIIFLVLLYRQYSVHYRLTNQRLIHEKGLLSRVTDRIETIDMDDITYTQGVIERMMNVGTITITSSDRTHPEMVLPGIENVRDVATLMDDARRQERRRRGLHIEAV